MTIWDRGTHASVDLCVCARPLLRPVPVAAAPAQVPVVSASRAGIDRVRQRPERESGVRPPPESRSNTPGETTAERRHEVGTENSMRAQCECARKECERKPWRNDWSREGFRSRLSYARGLVERDIERES